jgi:Na+-transporting NADH:ubiquinone oxidoreductase subunit NqrF
METCFSKGERHNRDLQAVVRYYISNRGCKIIKVNKADGREIQVEAGKWLQTEFNLYEIKPWQQYDINDDYYLDQVYKEIENISKKKENSQLTLF